MFKCPNYNHKSNKIDIRTTEIGTVKWFDSQIIDGEIVLGQKWEYEGGLLMIKSLMKYCVMSAERLLKR